MARDIDINENDDQFIDDFLVDKTYEEVIPFKYSISSYGADYPVDGLIKRLGNKWYYYSSISKEFCLEPKTGI